MYEEVERAHTLGFYRGGTGRSEGEVGDEWPRHAPDGRCFCQDLDQFDQYLPLLFYLIDFLRI